MNALLEPSVMEALYQASQAGVEIDLIIRGFPFCGPASKALSERIRVRSIVGRFLEHSRIFHFANGGNEEIYMGRPTGCLATSSSAAKWFFLSAIAAMTRIHDEILPAYLADTIKARIQQPDGSYLRASKLLKDAPQFSSQDFLIHLAEGKTDLDAIPVPAAARPAKPTPKVTVPAL